MNGVPKALAAGLVACNFMLAAHAECLGGDRPTSIVTVQRNEIRPVLQELSRIAEGHGFEATGGVDWNGGYFRAVRKEGDKREHRVAIWVQWNLQRPKEELDVYVAYGRYRLYTGGEWELEQTSPQEVEHAVGGLKKRILSFAKF